VIIFIKLDVKVQMKGENKRIRKSKWKEREG
jgi:hypothetical protein